MLNDIRLFDDIRFGFRLLLKSRGAAAIAVLALGIGIGANTASFIALKAMVLRPLPFKDLNRIVTLWETPVKSPTARDPASPANFLDWKEQAHSYQHLAAYRWWDVNLTGVDDPEHLQGYAVSPEFFPLLGMAPELGRGFSHAEAEPGHDQVVVLSHGFWQRRFGSDRRVLGRTVTLDGRVFTVVGVMPDDFDFPLTTDVWAPLALSAKERSERGARYLQVMGRLAPGVPIDAARAELKTIASRLERQYPQTNDRRDAQVVRLLEVTNFMTDRFVIILMCSSTFVLLLACANVANIQLARSTARAKELAVRTALGASRWRIARQLLIEALLVSLAGGAVAVCLAYWDTSSMSANIPAAIHKWVAGLRDIKVDGPVIAFTLCTSIAAGLLCGLGAVLQACGRRGNVNEALKQGGRSAASADRHALRNALVVGEVALAMVLLVGAGLMVKTFARMAESSPGYNPAHLLAMRIALQDTRYPAPAQQRSFYESLRERLAAVPAVRSACILGDAHGMIGFQVEGRPAPESSESLPAVMPASADTFRTLELPVHGGRPIGIQDGADSQPVVIVSDEVARRYWTARGEDPIGSRIRLNGPRSPWLTVAGVVGDVYDWFGHTPIPRVYTSFSQDPEKSAQILVRTYGDPLKIAPAARAEIGKLDRGQPVYEVKSVEQDLADMMSGVRMSARSMTVYAILALILALSGTYAVIAYSAARRTQEMGVRLALGAAPRDVLRLIVGQAVRLALTGLAIGLPAAIVLTRVMSSAVQGVVALDWTVFAGFTLLLVAAAALAGYIPARRAASIDPVTALRCE
jgi:putative ABC transport system permease protein